MTIVNDSVKKRDKLQITSLGSVDIQYFTVSGPQYLAARMVVVRCPVLRVDVQIVLAYFRLNGALTLDLCPY